MTNSTQNNLLEEALGYLDLGFSIIPVRGKVCLLPSWSEYQTRKPTKKEVENWFFDLNPTGIAIITGKISGIVVLDVENGADISGINIPKTPTVKTGGGGQHYYFKHPGNIELQNVIRFRDKMDFKADGGYVIAPPSQHKSGICYQWLNGFKETQLVNIPDWLIQDINRQQAQCSKSWEKIIKGVPEGKRTISATSIVGKLFRHLPLVKEWNTVAKPLIEAWNERNDPPLSEKELMQVIESIAKKEIIRRERIKSISDTSDSNVSKGIDLTPVSFKELLSTKIKEIQWTIYQLIPDVGITILSAPPAHHKTWLALYFAIQVSSGKQVFNRFNTKQCNVLFIEQDSGSSLIIERIKRLNSGDKSLPIQFLIRKGIKLENKQIVKKLMNLIKKENIGFVIFDSLIQFHNQDENINTDMAKVFEPLRRITDMGASVLVLHHHRKERGNEDNLSWKDRAQSLRGASSMLSLINSHLVIHRQNKNRSILRQTKLWEQEETNPLEFEIVDEEEKIIIKYLGEKEPEKDKKTLAKEGILEILKERRLSRSELAEELKDVASLSIIASIIAELKKSREIVVVDKKGKAGRIEVYGLVEDDPDFDDSKSV